MEVVDIKKILAPNLLIYIYLHCARSLSWCATTLATLIRVRFTFTSKYLKSVSISVLFYHFFTEVHLKKFREGWQKKRKMMRFLMEIWSKGCHHTEGDMPTKFPVSLMRQENPSIDIKNIAGFYTILRICNHTAE